MPRRASASSSHSWRWAHLHLIIDCCTREVRAWRLEPQARVGEAVSCLELALLERNVAPGRLTLGTGHRPQFAARPFRGLLRSRGVNHRRGSYRDPAPRAIVETWVDQMLLRCAHRHEWDELAEARRGIATYVDGYHHRPLLDLAYKSPADVAAAWRGVSH
ncbi:MAG: hypothetical protein RLZ14_756, partial [Actinomycetota bacterium]